MRWWRRCLPCIRSTLNRWLGSRTGAACSAPVRNAGACGLRRLCPATIAESLFVSGGAVGIGSDGQGEPGADAADIASLRLLAVMSICYAASSVARGKATASLYRQSRQAEIKQRDDLSAIARLSPGTGHALGLILEKLPLLVLVAGASAMEMWTHVKVYDPLTFSQKTANALVSCVAYLGQFVYPARLAAFYASGSQPAAVEAGSGVLLLLLITGAALVWRRRCPYLLVGWFWYLLLLAPVLGLVPVGCMRGPIATCTFRKLGFAWPWHGARQTWQGRER